MIGEMAVLVMTCAANVHPTTMDALVKHESQRHPYAIGVNSGDRLSQQPSTREEAIALAKTLMSKGIDFDAGLGQINVRNWEWLELNAETVFDPCANLKAAQTVLTDCYSRAIQRMPDEQKALQAALSCYNTGHFERGFRNGYVGKVLAQAGIKIPALQAPQSVPTGQETPAQPTNTDTPQTPAAESKPVIRGDRDGFVSNPAIDGFLRPVDTQQARQPEQPLQPETPETVPSASPP